MCKFNKLIRDFLAIDVRTLSALSARRKQRNNKKQTNMVVVYGVFMYVHGC